MDSISEQNDLSIGAAVTYARLYVGHSPELISGLSCLYINFNVRATGHLKEGRLYPELARAITHRSVPSYQKCGYILVDTYRRYQIWLRYFKGS